MRPEKALPYSSEYQSAEDYVADLLQFVTDSNIYQLLCGGVHVLDFFTTEPGLFSVSLPEEWQPFLLQMESMALLDFLMRDDMDAPAPATWPGQPPETLVQYVKDIRRLSLGRSFTPRRPKLAVLPRTVALGMKPKKKHEVVHFAGYVDELADEVASTSGKALTHMIDFGSGQNYLGRVLASPPYNKRIVAVEGREANMLGAKALDLLSGVAVAESETKARNKKVYQRALESVDASLRNDEEALKNAAKNLGMTDLEVASIDLRTRRELKATYPVVDGRGSIEYVVGRLEHADLADVVSQIQEVDGKDGKEDLRMMAISIHSCGNLSHYGIRSMVLNPCISAVAIVGCCYNLMTEKLGPPTYKGPFLRPTLQAINGRILKESEKRDPQGFPMSERLSTYDDRGVRLNITARMMACQAPQNWTIDSEDFFTRHFYRAVLQRIFFDRGVISRVYYTPDGLKATDGVADTPFNTSTNPVILGSLGKKCYASLNAYVRGAVKKLTTTEYYGEYSEVIQEKMGDITDEDIARYEEAYRHRRRELCIIWSLMAFSACVTESLIVTDRWLFLKEHSDIVRDCWVETVFDFRESPRNLVVVGIKS
ncbi:hypothetical protein GQ53DRAFT_831198 [Thozetella sp. PMI_491]|nr:hypothetical protein GQ53DRAFT_831198 [Thozetella sp. PMI_491]